MNNTSIEWVRTYKPDGSYEEGFSLNPIRFLPAGSSRSVTMCQKVSPGCANCYAENISRRWWPKSSGAFPGYTAQGVAAGLWSLNTDALLSVLKRKEPARIFWGDMTDLFQVGIPDLMLDACFGICALTPHLTHIFLTKRSERMVGYWRGELRLARAAFIGKAAMDLRRQRDPGADPVLEWSGLPMPNVILGFSAENQEWFDRRWEAMHWLAEDGWTVLCSAEPLLGPLDIRSALTVVCPRCLGTMSEPAPGGGKPCGLCFDSKAGQGHIDGLGWVITGGESTAKARPPHPDWFRNLRGQCREASVPFFFKQWGEWAPGRTATDGILSNYPKEASSADGWEMMHRAGKNSAGAVLDGKEWRQFPELEKWQVPA